MECLDQRVPSYFIPCSRIDSVAPGSYVVHKCQNTVHKSPNVKFLYITKPKPLIRSIKRLEVIRGLQNGWYDGKGLAPSKRTIKRAQEIVEQYPSLDPFLSIFPTVEGGVLFEFEIEAWDYSIEIEKNRRLEFLGVETNGSGEFGPDHFFTVEDLLAKLDQELGPSIGYRFYSRPYAI